MGKFHYIWKLVTYLKFYFFLEQNYIEDNKGFF